MPSGLSLGRLPLPSDTPDSTREPLWGAGCLQRLQKPSWTDCAWPPLEEAYSILDPGRLEAHVPGAQYDDVTGLPSPPDWPGCGEIHP